MATIRYGTFGLSGHRNSIVEQECFWTQMVPGCPIEFNHDN